jgi:hypothetical protein
MHAGMHPQLATTCTLACTHMGYHSGTYGVKVQHWVFAVPCLAQQVLLWIVHVVAPTLMYTIDPRLFSITVLMAARST